MAKIQIGTLLGGFGDKLERAEGETSGNQGERSGSGRNAIRSSTPSAWSSEGRRNVADYAVFDGGTAIKYGVTDVSEKGGLIHGGRMGAMIAS